MTDRTPTVINPRTPEDLKAEQTRRVPDHADALTGHLEGRPQLPGATPEKARRFLNALTGPVEEKADTKTFEFDR